MSFYLTAQYRISTVWIYNTDSSIPKLGCTKTLNILPLKNLKQNQLDLFHSLIRSHLLSLLMGLIPSTEKGLLIGNMLSLYQLLL